MDFFIKILEIFLKGLAMVKAATEMAKEHDISFLLVVLVAIAVLVSIASMEIAIGQGIIFFFLAVSGMVMMVVNFFCSLTLRKLALVVAIFTVVFTMMVLFIPGDTLKSVSKEDNSPILPSKCWKQFLTSWSETLSVTVEQSDKARIFELYSTANLICLNTKTTKFLKMLGMMTAARSESQLKLIFQKTHYDLLVNHVAKAGEECFVKFCRIFLEHPKYEKTGLELCKSCEVGCSDGLNGTWDHASDSCLVSTEFGILTNRSSIQIKENKVVFYIQGDECSNLFSKREDEYRAWLDPIVVDVNRDDRDDCDIKNRRCIVAYNNASLICSEGGIVASLYLNVEEEAVDKTKLKESLARLTGVNPSEIKLEIGPKDSTLVLMLLPPQAGMELLSIVINSERKRLFMKTLSSAVCSLADYVSVSVQISALPPIKMFFAPKEATSWLNEDISNFLAKFDENEMEDMAKVDSVSDVKYVFFEWIYFAFALLLVTVVCYTSFSHQTTTNTAKVGDNPLSLQGEERSVVKAFLSCQGWEFDAFICHAKPDRAFVAKLHDEMLKRGLRTYVHTISLQTGDTVQDTITHAIVNSPFFVVVLSNSFRNNLQSECEVETALAFPEIHKKIIPVFYQMSVDGCLKAEKELYHKLAAITGLQKGYKTEEQFTKSVSWRFRQMAVEQFQSSSLILWKPEGVDWNSKCTLDSLHLLSQLRDYLQRFKPVIQDLSRLLRIDSGVYQSKQSITTRSMMHTLKDLEQQVCRCFDKVDSCDDTLKYSKQMLGLARVNIQNQTEVNKQRRESLDEAAKSNLNISIAKAVDPVVASYVRTKQSLMSTSLQVDYLYEMSQQFAEVMQSLRERHHKFEISAPCHQLLEDVASRITGLMLVAKEEEQPDQKPDPPETASVSAVSESMNRRADIGPATEEATDVTVSSAVQQMAAVKISNEQQTVSRPVRHGDHSHSPAQKRRRGLSDQTATGSQTGADRHDDVGHTQSEQGWRCVYDSVMSLPHERVIRSVVEECAPDWYRLGIQLGFKDSYIRAMTYDILTPQSKLQAIIERKSMEHGKENTVKALLDVCDKIMPLTTIDIMKNLGIKHSGTVSDRSLYELGKMVGHDWKKLAKCLGLTSQDMENIKKKAKSSRKRARIMLQLCHAKLRGDFRVQEIYEVVEQIRMRKQTKQQTKHMIFPENVHSDKKVCGRSRELEGIATEFWGQTAADRMTPSGIPKYCLQVVNGMGGIGKSAVSEKYATKWQKMYGDGVFHFNAESLASLHISIRANLRHLSLESGGGGVFDDNKIFMQYVYSKDKVLLLYDGAVDLDLLKNILPRDTACVHVLVTTRMSGDHPILARANRITSLGRLGVDAGVEALQAWQGHAGKELDGQELMFARRLVSESPIEGLPLAITQVATCIRMGQIRYQQYYELFKKEQGVLQALALDLDKLLHYFRISNLKEPLMRRGMSKPNDLSRLSVEDIQTIATEPNDRHLLSLARHFIVSSNPVHLTWQLDIETVKDTDKNAMNLLLYISLMSCRNIPERVVRPLLFSDMFAYEYRMSVSTLRSHALVDVYESNEGCNLHIHPLVQSTLLERVMRQPDELHYRLNRMAHSLLCLLPHSDNDILCHLRDDQFLSLIPHVYAVAEKALWIRDDETCDNLVQHACAIAYQSQNIDVTAYLCHKRLEAAAMSGNNWQHLTALFNMGRSCQLMANPQSAQLYFMEALQLIENSSDHEKARMEHYYQLVLGSLARCYENQQMFTDAERLSQTQLSLLKERPGENRDKIAAALHNLAGCYSSSGQIQKSIETYEEVLEMKRGDQETPSLSLSISMQNMAGCLMDNGQVEEALPLLEMRLSIMREHLPGDHVDFARALGMLSRCCEELGDVQRAMSLCEESVAIASQCLPNGHPFIAEFVGRLASCHRHAGRLDQAIHLTQHCIVILRQSMPSTRKELCRSLNNLGQLYKEKGMLAEAVSRFEECLAANRLFLNADHPEIGMTLWNLGGAYEARNDVIKATELWRECLSIFEKCLSATHPHLLNVLTSLGRITYDQEQYHESLQMFVRSLDILMKVSPKSMEMATVCCNMGSCYVKLSQFDTAEEAFSQALSIFTALVPQEHHMISNTEQALHQVWQLKFGQW